MVVLFVIGVLSTVLIKTYLQMSNISFRVEQEKNVTQEVLFVSEVLQNLADRNSIDYKAYADHLDGGIAWLTHNNWLVDVLYLSWLDGHISIYSMWEHEWDCVDPWVSYSTLSHHQNDEAIPRCRVQMEDQDWKTTILTNKKKAYLSKALFKIIPFATTDAYFNWWEDGETWSLCDTNYLVCPHHPGFRLLMKAYSNNYWLNWSNNILIPVQQFFNLQ